MNDTMCALPFMAVDRHFDRIKPCCLYNSDHWQQFASIDQYRDSADLAILQMNLLNGNRDPGCAACWKMEDIQQMSMRQSINVSRLAEINLAAPRITQVKLLVGKICNLACMMCFSSVSSTYQQLWRNESTWIMPLKKSQDLNYDYDMDKYIREHAGDLRYIEVLGGEPLFSKSFLDLAQHLIDIGVSHNITLYIITNATLITPAMIKTFGRFKKTIFTVSIDGVGTVNEYQRWPSQWKTVDENLIIMTQNFDVSVLPTVTAINIARLSELYNYCETRNLVINNTNLVGDWPQLLPSNLPDTIKSLVDPKFVGFLQGESNTESLCAFIKKWDRQRGISIGDYMPEWRNVL